MFTSKQILESEDLYDLQDMASSAIAIKYEMTGPELGWLDFVRGRYMIADYIDQNRKGNILSISDEMELSEALDADCHGWGKATCLSDDTALQKIFFWLYSETEADI